MFGALSIMTSAHQAFVFEACSYNLPARSSGSDRGQCQRCQNGCIKQWQHLRHRDRWEGGGVACGATIDYNIIYYIYIF